MNYHTHKYKFECKTLNGHKHKISGYSENLLGINNFHLHHFYGTSSYSNHTHYFSGITGLPIKTENGHIHKMEGALELNNAHEHKFNGHTFEEISYVSGQMHGEAYI